MIDILLIQETKDNRVHVEYRDKYPWFNGGNPKTQEQTLSTDAGVVIIINNKILEQVKQINPISDRLMSITFKGTVETTFINAYMYTGTEK